jgi:hypothetical protein
MPRMIKEEILGSHLKRVIIAAALAAASWGAGATTFIQTIAVTGSASPGDTTQVSYSIPSNWHFTVVAVLPVVASVSANPASMNAAVQTNAPWNVYDNYVAQWTIVAGASGVQVSPAFQLLSPLYLFSATAGSVKLRCSVGNMAGSCIFVTRMIPSGDPVF